MEKLHQIEELPGRLYAVGDLHGCADELALLLDFLKENDGILGADYLIFVGDYVDRGPDSKGVIDLLIDLQRDFPNIVFLRGNHEDMLLEFLGYDGNLSESYLINGGTQFLKSYGLSGTISPDEILALLPATHMSFLLNLESYAIAGEYVFSHAGLNPERSLYAQINDDLYWIRDAFIAGEHDFGKTVVFGHTPYQDILLHLPYKLGIDTGLVFGNMLTCVELTRGRILQIDHGCKGVKVDTFAARGVRLGPEII